MGSEAGVQLIGDWREASLTFGRLMNPDWKALHEEVGEVIVSGTNKHFKDQQGPDGEAWKPSKRAEAEAGQTLIITAALKNSIHAEATRDQVTVGTNVIYSRVHQLGWPERNIPERPYLGIDADMRKEIEETVQAFMEEVAL